MLLCTANPEKMNDIIRMKDVNTLKILLDDLFSTNPSLVERFGIGRNLKFELEERHNSEFLGKRQGRYKYWLQKKIKQRSVVKNSTKKTKIEQLVENK